MIVKQSGSYSCALNVQDSNESSSSLLSRPRPSRPPSHPFIRHPASSLPPTSGPKRRGHAVSETRTGQVVWGFCTQNQMLVGAAGMLVRPLWYPLTSDTAYHACIVPSSHFAPPYLTNRYVCMHHCSCIRTALCSPKFIFSVVTCCTGCKQNMSMLSLSVDEHMRSWYLVYT